MTSEQQENLLSLPVDEVIKYVGTDIDLSGMDQTHRYVFAHLLQHMQLEYQLVGPLCSTSCLQVTVPV